MKVIEAMKRVKANKEKIADLQQKIAQNSANTSIETPLYENTKDKISEWLQSCQDTVQESVRLLTAISRTNLQTQVSIVLDSKTVTKPVAEWVWRRREYAAIDLKTFSMLTDRNIKEIQVANTTGGEPVKVTVVRNYDPEHRDKMMDTYRTEPHEIDAALEVSNAITDLVEG